MPAMEWVYPSLEWHCKNVQWPLASQEYDGKVFANFFAGERATKSTGAKVHRPLGWSKSATSLSPSLLKSSHAL